MQSTTGNPFTNSTNSTSSLAPTKSKEQLLIQSSGAMIAVIVIGIIVILALLLIILKTYHRCTHTARLMGRATTSKSRTKSSSTAKTNLPLGQRGATSASANIAHLHSTARNGFRLPRAVASEDPNNSEQLSTISDSTVVTIHSAPPLENT
ncbi:hypothetical protein SKAU_G00427790 [Synaphobranchus kaupii]|uniref:Noncompact myelin-associated protein n=1 Tax=Synaphobranchus kaupii TaxID=118154 RepID=A0A9Q1IA93_SYNKA|nr:hypothetical protein SKAU_G00427790 [Synaphobranchus kaupii]